MTSRYRKRVVAVRVSTDEGAVLDLAARVLGFTTATLMRTEALRTARAIAADKSEPQTPNNTKAAPTGGQRGGQRHVPDAALPS